MESIHAENSIFISTVDNEACIECNQLDPADIGNCIQPSMITHNLTRCIGTNNNNTCFSYVNERKFWYEAWI